MKFDRQSFRRRRKERLARLYRDDYYEAEAPPPPGRRETLSGTPGASRLQRQTAMSLLLLLLLFALFRTETPLAKAAQEWTRQVMTKDYDFKGTVLWLEEKLGEFPSLLPTIRIRTEENEAVEAFYRPLEGTVVEDFGANGSGVIIETGKGAEVHPVGTGWVKYVGTRDETGRTVIIQHGGGKESVYGFLGSIYVKKDDWVYPDSVIGVVSNRSLYLQIRQGDQLLDPLDVISFE